MSRRRKVRLARRPRKRPVHPVPVRPALIGLGGMAAILIAIGALGSGALGGNAMERAIAFHEAGDFNSARVEAMNAVRDEPGNERGWHILAETQIALGDSSAAVATMERARASGIAAERTRHLMAEAALVTGDIDVALGESMAEDIPAEFADEAARVEARALFAEGDVQGAADAFDRAIELNEESDGLWLDIANFRFDTGEQQGAITAVDTALEYNENNLEALVLKGRLSREQYGLLRSIEWFDKALEIDPQYLPALVERAKSLGELGRYRDMLDATRDILDRYPKHATALYLQAAMAARARNYPLARRIIELIDGDLDGMPAMELLRAAVDYEQHNYEATINRLTRLVEDRPWNRSAVRMLGAAYFHSGDMDATIETLTALADRTDADSYILLLVGRALERKGEFEQASEYLARGFSPGRGPVVPLGNRPRDAVALTVLERNANRNGGVAAQVELIRAYLLIGQTDAAVARAQNLARRFPQSPDAHIVHGDALGARGRMTEAAEAYRSAANIRFSEAVALRLVEAFERSGQTQEARRALALYRQQNPRNVRSAFVSARLNLRHGRWRQAANILDALRMRIGDRDAAVLANLAWARHELGQADSAVALARRAYLLMPMNSATSEIYGWILFDSGEDRARGLALMQKARSLAPDNPSVDWHLALAYARLDRADDARAAAERALESPLFALDDEARALIAGL